MATSQLQKGAKISTTMTCAFARKHPTANHQPSVMSSPVSRLIDVHWSLILSNLGQKQVSLLRRVCRLLNASSRLKSANPGPKAHFHLAHNEIVYGQLQCAIEGAINTKTDGMNEEAPRISGGTILQRSHQFRVKAKIGDWQISTVKCGLYDGDAQTLLVHHSSADPCSLALRCREYGINHNPTPNDDKFITYINRYDWSWIHQKPDNVVAILKCGSQKEKHSKKEIKEEEEEEVERCELDEKVGEVCGRCCYFLDASEALPILKADIERLKTDSFGKYTRIITKDESSSTKNHVTAAAAMKNSAGLNPSSSKSSPTVGCYLSIPNTEYELGWLVFEESSNELIGFCYDSYRDFPFGESAPLLINDRIAYTIDDMHDQDDACPIFDSQREDELQEELQELYDLLKEQSENPLPMNEFMKKLLDTNDDFDDLFGSVLHFQYRVPAAFKMTEILHELETWRNAEDRRMSDEDSEAERTDEDDVIQDLDIPESEKLRLRQLQEAQSMTTESDEMSD